ncbi:uncharacterized protein LOC133911165 [Phragmites australis]|uniref:uncharacterized protein LOC133911165 n=1 Tax=Phragmites australis TaxID=29695 RepID=UPI002D76CC9A|nr:uncharacterized protein LOC133911165 [Phragmites australis]
MAGARTRLQRSRFRVPQGCGVRRGRQNPMTLVPAFGRADRIGSSSRDAAEGDLARRRGGEVGALGGGGLGRKRGRSGPSAAVPAEEERRGADPAEALPSSPPSAGSATAPRKTSSAATWTPLRSPPLSPKCRTTSNKWR